jgi:hypothetical protein
MLLGFFGERFGKEGSQRFPTAQGISQDHLVVAEETGPQPSIGGQTHAITGFAVRVRHGRNFEVHTSNDLSSLASLLVDKDKNTAALVHAFLDPEHGITFKLNDDGIANAFFKLTYDSTT